MAAVASIRDLRPRSAVPLLGLQLVDLRLKRGQFSLLGRGVKGDDLFCPRIIIHIIAPIPRGQASRTSAYSDSGIVTPKLRPQSGLVSLLRCHWDIRYSGAEETS